MSDGELFSQIFWLCTILLQKTAKKKKKKKSPKISDKLAQFKALSIYKNCIF